MNRISGPAGLPHSCAEMVRPSGVFTVIGLYFTSCPKLGCAIVTTKAAAAVILTRRRFQTKFVIEILPLFFCYRPGYHARSEGESRAGERADWPGQRQGRFLSGENTHTIE